MRDPVILQSAVVLIGLLTFAQLVIWILEKRGVGGDLTEVKIRTRSWWVIFILIEAALYFGKGAVVGLFACVSFFALREYLSRVPTRICDRKALFWAFLSIPLQFWLVYKGELLAFLCFIPLYGISVLAIRLLLTGQPKGFVLGLSTFQLGLLTTVYSISHIAYLPILKVSGQMYGQMRDPMIGNNQFEVSAGTLLFFICIAQLNDIFQFISGKIFGKRKIMPQISPKKTVEGFLGGVILSSLTASVVAPYLTPLTFVTGAMAGAVLSIFGFFGDVFMSAIKRDLEIKDFSQIIPGHGGVLDRIDSLVISAPLYFHLIRILTQGV